MLEITLLKTMHSGTEEARKLVPYIQRCDVYSRERAGMKEDNAIKQEKEWAEALIEVKSRTRLKQEFIGCINRQPEAQEVKDYCLSELDYLWRNKIPQFFMERWRGPVLCDHPCQEGLKNFQRFLDNMKNGYPNEAIDFYRMATKQFDESARLRELNMAENIRSAEEKIRARNPALRSKDPLKLLINLGAAHNLEIYVPEVRVYWLFDQNTEFWRLEKQTEEMIRAGASNEDLMEPLSRYYEIEVENLRRKSLS